MFSVRRKNKIREGKKKTQKGQRRIKEGTGEALWAAMGDSTEFHSDPTQRKKKQVELLRLLSIFCFFKQKSSHSKRVVGSIPAWSLHISPCAGLASLQLLRLPPTMQNMPIGTSNLTVCMCVCANDCFSLHATLWWERLQQTPPPYQPWVQEEAGIENRGEWMDGKAREKSSFKGDALHWDGTVSGIVRYLKCRHLNIDQSAAASEIAPLRLNHFQLDDISKLIC